MLPVSEKVIILNLIRKEKISYDQVATIYSKNKATHEIVKKKKEIHASFAVAPQSLNKDSVGDKCLVKVVKALYLYNNIFWEKALPHNFYYSIWL